VIAGLTLVTLATRSLFLLLGDRVALPARIRHGLRLRAGVRAGGSGCAATGAWRIGR